jgi:hypothetical protein
MVQQWIANAQSLPSSNKEFEAMMAKIIEIQQEEELLAWMA